MDDHRTREEWLLAAVAELAPLFADVGATVPPVRVSVGWPGGSGRKANVIGQCWAPDAAADGVAQLFVSPVLGDAERVLDVLLHELVHAVDRNVSGHRGRFVTLARAVGLEGKPTETIAGDDLRGRLAPALARLGPYPHAPITPKRRGSEDPKTQGTRMLKVSCAEGSGYVARITRKWLDEYGAPICPCHGERMLEG